MRRALALACVALFAAGASAAMYRWVDEKGVTHYSENPPPDGKPATRIEVKPTPPSSAPRPAESWKDRELESRRRRLEKEQVEDSARAKGEQEAASRRRRCLAAQRELHVLTAGVPIYNRDSRGERVYLEDKDRPAEIAAWKRLAEENCER